MICCSWCGAVTVVSSLPVHPHYAYKRGGRPNTAVVRAATHDWAALNPCVGTSINILNGTMIHGRIVVLEGISGSADIPHIEYH
jgi:hypothetical protein